uniref:Neuralized n=1 Tax=Acrobeloides nanus TaxID=290746 RepID=A0A914C7B4_9BILA
MGNTSGRSGSDILIEGLPADYDYENTINRGTTSLPQPQLKFHTVHGTNVQLLRDGRIARRKESFCKGLVFSNRPIQVDEIVCIRLTEVVTNWSGVLRFGVTNVDPASFRDIELPKFACPDLTSKGGYWAKALAERYSIEKSILHFYINAAGEMYYGLNGVPKGIFLNGINTTLPIWVVVDIYGNSVGIEFLDSNDVRLRGLRSLISELNPRGSSPSSAPSATPRSSGNNLQSSEIVRQRSRPTTPTRLRFHSTVKGVNITLYEDDTVARRKHGEYNLGYCFTERPIRADEKIVIQVLSTETAFTGSLAFGLTSCDPIHVPASRLPIDTDELMERPEYWVSIKDVAASPAPFDILTFSIDSTGQVRFSKNNATPRVIMHVDMSIQLWAFFDAYGSTSAIKLLDSNASQISPNRSSSISENARNARAVSETRELRPLPSRPPPPNRSEIEMRSLRVALPPTTASSSIETPSSFSTDDLTTNPLSQSLERDPISSLRYTVNNIGNDYRQTIRAELFGTPPLIEPQVSRITFPTLPSPWPRNPPPIVPARIRDSSLSAYNTPSRTSPSRMPTESRLQPTPLINSQAPLPSTMSSSSSTTTTSIVPNSVTSDANNSTPSTSSQAPSGRDPSVEPQNECTICMSNAVNSVIYRCGHMCMCFECARRTHQVNGECPICRQPIIDVIRCFPV